MTNDDAKNALVESTDDSKASILAAIARIESVPAGDTLIDSISEDDWAGESGVQNWQIEAGSDKTASSEELDESDKASVRVA